MNQCVLLAIDLYCLNNTRRPLDDQALQAVPLVQVSEHVLLQSLSWLFARLALVVILVLRLDYLDEELFCLFKRVQLHGKICALTRACLLLLVCTYQRHSVNHALRLQRSMALANPTSSHLRAAEH